MKRRRRFVALGLLARVGLSPSAALADSTAAKQKQVVAPTTAPIVQVDERKNSGPGAGDAPDAAAQREAAIDFEKAEDAYAKGDTEGAFNSMSACYQHSKRPELLYNLAQLEGELHRCQAALEDYRRYIQQVPQGEYRVDAERASQSMEQQCSSDPAAPAVPQPEPPTPLAKPQVLPLSTPRATDPTPHHPANASAWPVVIGLSLVATGVLCAVGAVHFTLAAKNVRDDAHNSVNAAVRDDTDYSDDGRQREQHRDQALAWTLGVGGGALLTGGAVLLSLAARGSSRALASAPVLLIQPRLIGAQYSRSF